MRWSLRSHLLLCVTLPLLIVWVSTFFLHNSWQRDSAHQANEIGHELARQIADSLLGPLQADDQLSLNLQLAQWRQNPLIAQAKLYGADNRILAESGRPRHADELAPGEGTYIASIQHQDNLVGRLHISLAGEPFRTPLGNLLNTLQMITLFLLLLAGTQAWFFGTRLRQLLQQLGNWSAEQDQPPPGAGRKDELGELAQRLLQRRIIDQPLPVLEDISTEDDDATVTDAESATATHHLVIDLTAGITDEDLEAAAEDVVVADPPTEAAKADIDGQEAAEPATAVTDQAQTLVLAVGIGPLDTLQRLPRQRLLALLERYRSHVQQAARLYSGSLQALEDGGTLISFAFDEDNSATLKQALCCGELLRILAHDLQIEIADTGQAVHMRLALGRCAAHDSLSALLADEGCQSILDHLQHSRNLLLVDAAMAEQEAVKSLVLTRRLASQPDIHCIERLNEPYQSLLEKQLNHIYQQRS
ncbi:Uncharacterized membrane protein affecting hemolysin expression [Halopseudomonas salegens]|uniref:Uncharacterized membrane protein affecting hemolysin expression n=1 Tax=Halopseudomonas salegens TaxID=1434072 RepID=A0A1H2ENA2_9GAMM|nr:Uncharacterized membrane protein affecting hemolysin expression [Halopseudomonas salegens]